MRQLLLSLLWFFISYVHTQILFECNFDSSTDNCFTPRMTISSNIGIPDFVMPNTPLSDVTSSLKPTNNGELCKLPYRIDSYDWNMYFCNRGYCPTESNPNSQCQLGKFGFVELINNEMKSFQLKTKSDRINAIDQQCLIYYYYMDNINEKIITVRKEETNGKSQIIDSVTNSSFNGWIQRKIPFNVETSGYKIHFEVQKLSGISVSYIGFDEISFHQGGCNNQRVFNDLSATATELILAETTTITSISDETTMLPTAVSTTITTSSTTTTVSVETSSKTTTVLVETSSTTTMVPAETSSTTTVPVETSTANTVPIETSTTTTVTFETTTSVQTTITSTPTESTTTSIPVQTSTTTTVVPPETIITNIQSETTMTSTPVETSMTSISESTTTTTITTTTSVQTTEITSISSTPITTFITSTTITTIKTTTITETTAEIETSYSEAIRTEETTEFSTITSRFSTVQPSSSTTTTIVIISTASTFSTTPISMESTDITTNTYNVSDTTNPISSTTSQTTTSTVTVITTTTTTNENTVITSYDQTLPYEKSHIIIMATVIPVLWLAFIIALCWARRSTDVIGSIFHPFNNLSRAGKTWGSYELSNVSEA